MTPALTLLDWLEGPVMVLLLIAAVAARIMADNSREWSDGMSSGSLFSSERSRTGTRPRLRQRQPELPPAAVSRQWQDESTGEITAQDLDEEASPRPVAAQPGRMITEEEELELIRERRWRVRQRLPQLAEQMYAQWESMADGLGLLTAASQAAPGVWELPPQVLGDASPPPDSGWEQRSAGPLQVGAAEMAQHEVIDRNHNGIPDHLETESGRRWTPLSFSERAWRSVLEAEQGPAVLLSALKEQMHELFAAQALMGFPLRLQGPLEEVRSIILRAFAACDERVNAEQRQEMRDRVLLFIERDLPRMRVNLAQAAANMDEH